MSGRLTRRGYAAAALAAAMACAVAGCSHSTRGVTSAASAVLTADVTRLQVAATRGSTQDVGQAAERLRADVSAQRTGGGLSSDRAAAILDQLARILADTAARPSPSAAPVTPSPAPKRGGEQKGNGGDGDSGEGD